MPNFTNSEIAGILYEMAQYLEMQDVPFKPRAYEKVAVAVEGLEEQIVDIYKRGGIGALEEIPGIGKGIAERIEEFLKTGKIRDYEKLKHAVPVDLSSLRGVEGLGPKKIKTLYNKLGVKNLADLESAVKSGKIAKLEGFGKKSEDNILKGIEFVKKSGGRFVLGFVMPEILMIEERLRKQKGVEKIVVAGSTRRRKETIGDLDILIVSEKSKSIMDYFVSMPEVARVLAHGETKSAVKLKSGMDADLRVVAKESFGAAMNYFTGSKAHNIALRTIAIKRGFKLNEYGLWRGNKQIAGEDEIGLYGALGADYIEPEMRENTGEIELATKHQLPKLVGYDDLQGDLQVQTNWTDGSGSIEDMARTAISLGLKYIAVTDHSKRLAMTHGLDEKRILKQINEIDRLNKKFAGKIKILKGSECDILRDGTLDLPDKVLSKLDIVGASVHSYFNLSRSEQTDRIVRAIENKNVDILFHPTGRIINRREPYDVDMDVLIKMAKRTATIVEIDAYPDRLDLKDEYIRKCVDAGVKMSIDSDAHSPAHFAYLEYGISQARRGWAERKDIINAWPLEKMLGMLKK